MAAGLWQLTPQKVDHQLYAILRAGNGWWLVNIGSGNGLVSSSNNPLAEPMLILWCHMASPGHNELMNDISKVTHCCYSPIKTSRPELEWINLLWPSDAICHFILKASLSALGLAMTSLVAPSHYLIQCWLICRKILRDTYQLQHFHRWCSNRIQWQW